MAVFGLGLFLRVPEVEVSMLSALPVNPRLVGGIIELIGWVAELHDVPRLGVFALEDDFLHGHK